MNPRRKGVLITALGVLCLTPDALLVRLIACDSWTLLFWRGLLMCFGLLLFLTLRRPPSPGQRLKTLGPRGILAAAFLACSTTCFVLSLERTAVANTLVIIASAPLLAACFSWLFLGEKAPLRTWLAILTAMVGIAITVSGSLEAGTGHGDLFALGSAICMAGHFTALRWWRSADGPAAVCLAGLLAALLALPWSSPLSPQGMDFLWIPLLGLIVLPLAFGLMAIGPRYLPAAEVSLFLLAETALGPLWVWLVMNEQPPPSTFLGGFIVVTTLVAHAIAGRRGASAQGEV